MPPSQDCLQCGKCCEKWGWGQKGVIEDLVPWIDADRQDILQHVSLTFSHAENAVTGGILYRRPSRYYPH